MRRVFKNLQQGRTQEKAQDIEATMPVKKSKCPGTTSIRVFSGAADRMGSESIRICRSYIF